MKTTDYPVASPPKPPRKVRQRPLTMRERGIAVVCLNGKFVMPKEAFYNSPMAIAIIKLTVDYYNETSDLKVMKRSCESVMAGTYGAVHQGFQKVLTWINKRIRKLISLAHDYRCFVLEFENGKPVNEPTSWERV